MPDEGVSAYAVRLARAKAGAGFAQLNGPGVVLGADTVVSIGGRILGKPRDREHALAMLAELSDDHHQVITAIAVTDGQRCLDICVGTHVYFRAITREEAERYWPTGEPLDKAGGYASPGPGRGVRQGVDGQLFDRSGPAPVRDRPAVGAVLHPVLAAT